MTISLETPTPTGTVAVSALNVTRTFGRGSGAVRALDGVSANLRRGELTTITGPSGAGKSTLVQCLAGTDRVSGGRVFLGGREISPLRGRALHRATQGRVSVLVGLPRLLPEWSILQNILLPLDLADGHADPAHLRRVVDALELENLLTLPGRALTSVQQQRVALARAAITQPEVIFADTVCGSQDGASCRDLPLALLQVCRQLGITAVHAARQPNPHADRVLTLDHGVLIADQYR